MAGEGKLQDKIIAFLTPMRDIYFINKWGNGVEEGGIHDIIMCKKGQFITFELKNPNGKGKIAKRQEIHRKKVQRAGGKSYFVETFEQFLEIFHTL